MPGVTWASLLPKDSEVIRGGVSLLHIQGCDREMWLSFNQVQRKMAIPALQVEFMENDWQLKRDEWS